MTEVRKRSRPQTMARILQAVGEVIAEQGTNRVGINAVAEKAGVNKVLIYRYFGGWEGLMQQFLHDGSFLTDYNKQFLETQTTPEQASTQQNRIKYLTGLLNEFRSRPSAQETLKWEISNPGLYVSPQLASARKESYQKIIEAVFSTEKEDLNAVTAILISGLALLTLLGTNQSNFMNIDLQSNESWQQIEQAIQRIYTKLE